MLHRTQLTPNISIKMFDQLIKPICLYASEFWGPFIIKDPASLHDSIDKMYESLESVMSEKLNISFCKYILGVHRKAQNSSIRGELGRLPLGLDIVANICKYVNRLESTDISPILKEAYTVSKESSYPNNKYLGSFTSSHKKWV